MAVQVEDHPLGYEKFTGYIPEGEYGAGAVEIQDKGYYRSVKQDKSQWEIDIVQEKLKGIYCLLKLKKNNPQDKNWLFFKMNPK